MITTKKFTAKIRASLIGLLALRELEPTLANAIDFMIDGAFYDLDDEYFMAAMGDEEIQKRAQWFRHRKFTRLQNGHYYNGTLKKSIHVAIWEFYRGEIPDDCVIHHIDFNPANNALSNLQMMTRSEHMSLHNAARQKKLFTCTYCGRKFYKYDNRPDTEHNFCSVRCDTKWRELKKLYHEERTCVICGEKFSVRKSSKTKVCSPHCRGVLAARTKNSKANPVTDGGQTLREIAAETGISFNTIRDRWRRGWRGDKLRKR